jgi:glycyl-tRNA synthetase beta chain
MTTTSTQPLLIELGCEEIPAGVVPLAGQALLDALVQALDIAGVTHGEARWLGTPRRLVAHVQAVAVQQPDRTEVLTGPPWKAARTPDGAWSKAAEGFAKGQGLELDALTEVDTPKGPYVGAHKTTPGRPTAQVLAEQLPTILRNLPFPKRMRWGREREAFVRPVHWLVALLGGQVLDFTFAGVNSGKHSQGHRFYANRAIEASADLDAYQTTLLDAKVMLDPAARRHAILRGIQQLANEAGGTWVEDQATLDVVTHLVEWPAPLLGEFAPEFLEIPAPVIRTTLRENQKLFTLTGPDGALLNRFIAVANTLSEASRATVAAGNARVVSARLADARFFVQEDCKQALESYLPRLGDRIYLQGLGSLGDRVVRVTALAGAIARHLCPGDVAQVERAALLAKCDLATRMVFEFPELQGFVGADYARRAGEDPVVIQAIAEHYQPRFAGDAVPGNAAGTCVALADKIDAVVGCFALGLIPTGTQDPYALRRQALGILRILDEGKHDLPLSTLTTLALDALRPALGERPVATETLREDVLKFFRGRMTSLHQAEFPVDLVEAVLDAGFDDVATVLPRLRAFDHLRSTGAFTPLAAAFKRVANIVRKSGSELTKDATVQPGLLAEGAESQLHDVVQARSAEVRELMGHGDYARALESLAAIKPSVDKFFEDVMVMTEDTALRHNRLALLRACAGLFAQLADFARIQA